jgi:hypothetical protein
LTLVKIFHPLAKPRKRADCDRGGSHEDSIDSMRCLGDVGDPLALAAPPT